MSKPNRLVAEMVAVVSALEQAVDAIRPLTEPLPERLEHVANILPRLGDVDREALMQACADLRAVANSLESWSDERNTAGRRQLLWLYITADGQLEVDVHHEEPKPAWVNKLCDAVLTAAAAVASEELKGKPS